MNNLNRLIPTALTTAAANFTATASQSISNASQNVSQFTAALNASDSSGDSSEDSDTQEQTTSTKTTVGAIVPAVPEVATSSTGTTTTATTTDGFLKTRTPVNVTQASNLFFGFAKQALSSMETQIDRVLDIKQQQEKLLLPSDSEFGSAEKTASSGETIFDRVRMMGSSDSGVGGSVQGETALGTVASDGGMDKKEAAAAPVLLDGDLALWTMEPLEVPEEPVSVTVQEEAPVMLPEAQPKSEPFAPQEEAATANEGKEIHEATSPATEAEEPSAGHSIFVEHSTESKVTSPSVSPNPPESTSAALSNASQPEQQRLLQALCERDQKIQDLLEHAQELTNKNAQLTQTIHTLQSDTTSTPSAPANGYKDKWEASRKECGELQERVDALELEEERYKDAVVRYNELVETQQRTIAKLETDVKAQKEQVGIWKEATEKGKKEVEDLRKLNATSVSAAQTELLEAAKSENVALREKVERLGQESANLEIAYKKELFELRGAMTRLESEMGWKEDGHRQEISMYQSRIQDVEMRMQDLVANAQESSRPFLRQIEALQSQNATALQNWENVERHLNSRVVQAEAERDRALEQGRNVEITCAQLQENIKYLDVDVQRWKKESLEWQSKVEAVRGEMLELQVQKERLEEQITALRRSHASALEMTNETIRNAVMEQLEDERMEWVEKKRTLEDKVRQLEQQLRQVPEAIQVSTVQSPAERRASQQQFSTADLNASPGTFPYQSKVAQLESQLGTLQEQLVSVTESRDEYAEELVRQTLELTTLKQSQHSEYQHKLSATLELLGEKSERVKELELDVQEMKEVYRKQVEELVDRLEAREHPRGKKGGGKM